MKQEKIDQNPKKSSFRTGFFLLGILPLGAGFFIRYRFPEWEAGSLWQNLSFLLVLGITGGTAGAALGWAARSRTHGLYTLGALALLAGWIQILFWGTASLLMDSTFFFSALPGPAGLVTVLLLGAWAKLYEIRSPDSDKKAIYGRWLLTVPALLPAAVLFFITPLETGVFTYILIVLVPQILVLLGLLHKVPRQLSFLPAAAAAELFSTTMGFILLTPVGKQIPQTAGLLSLGAGAWILLYGLRRHAGEKI